MERFMTAEDFKMNLLSEMEIRSVFQSEEESKHDKSIMTTIDDPCNRVYKTAQAYNYEKREEEFITNTTKEEALKNAHQLIVSEEMAKIKAEKKEAKKKRQRERKKAEMAENGDGEKTTSSNSKMNLDRDTAPKTNKTKTAEKIKNEGSELSDQEDVKDDDFLDVNAAFVKVSMKQNKNIAPHKTSIPKPEKVGSPPDATSMPTPKRAKLKFPKSQSDNVVAETLGKQSYYLALNDNDYDSAIKFLSRAIFLAPEDVRHLLNRSYCYLRLGQYDLALNDAQSAKINSPSSEYFARAVAREAQALCGLKQYHEAEKCYEEVLKFDKGNVWICTELLLTRAFQLTKMGFSMMNALRALQQCSTVVDAVMLLTSGCISSAELETNNNKSEIEIHNGEEIYFSDDESSSTILLSKLVSTMADESSHLRNLRSQSSSSDSERTLKSIGSVESLPRSNSIKSNGSTQWQSMNDIKSVSSTRGTQIPKGTASASSSIWVGNLDKTISDHQMRQLFEKFGEINYIRRFPDARNYGFVDFNSKKAAYRALNHPKDLEINGIKLPVRPASRFSGKK